MPNAYAKDNYPELISPHPARQSDYIRWAKSSAIGIYSRGLFGSVAFKMAEFLASSKCIISEPIDNALPGPTEYLSVYRSTEECIALCDRLLTSPKTVQEGRKAAWAYYKGYARPDTSIAHLIATAS